MGRRLRQLLYSLLALAQLIVFGLLLPIYGAILVIVGVLNLLWFLLTGSGFSNFDLVWEPLRWAIHQFMVLFAASSDFRAAPYIG
jgi:hypothetical protein